MINREEFERYLCNNYNCTRARQGNDVALRHTVGGTSHTASLGNHSRTTIHAGEARRFLQDLGFTGADLTDIRRAFGI